MPFDNRFRSVCLFSTVCLSLAVVTIAFALGMPSENTPVNNCSPPRVLGEVVKKTNAPPSLTISVMQQSTGISKKNYCTSLVDLKIAKSQIWQLLKEQSQVVVQLSSEGVIQKIQFTRGDVWFLVPMHPERQDVHFAPSRRSSK